MANMMSDMSSKYKEIISKCQLMTNGNPSRYRLSSQKESFGHLRRVTLGEKDPHKENKTILVVGETGTGKSALIDTMVNYAMGVKWEDKIWFQIVEDQKGSQSESQTSGVTVYEIFEGKIIPYSLTIIDTPGFGDTRGIEQDYLVNQQLLDLFRSGKGIQEINAVGFVVKSTENRLSDRMRYIFDSVVSLFGKDMEQNIVALVTHSNGMPPKNTFEVLKDAKIKCAKNEKNQPVHFLFDNCHTEARTEETEMASEYAWKVTMRGMDQFSKFLEGTSSQTMETTVHVLNERIRLTACIQNLQQRIEWIELKQTQIRQTQEALKKHEKEMEDNKNFTVEVDTPYKDKEDIVGWWPNKAVCCTVCEETCHRLCTMAWDPSWCQIMKAGHCTSCTGKCPASDHVRGKWRYVNKTRKETMTLKEVKDKFEKNKEQAEKKKSLLPDLEEEMEENIANKAKYLEEAYQHVVKLEEIALNADSLSTQVHLDYLIKKMQESAENETGPGKVSTLEKVKKLVEMKDRMDKGPKSGLQYIRNAAKLSVENTMAQIKGRSHK